MAVSIYYQIQYNDKKIGPVHSDGCFDVGDDNVVEMKELMSSFVDEFLTAARYGAKNPSVEFRICESHTEEEEE